MTSTPTVEASGPSASATWSAAILLGLLGALIVVGLATGKIRLNPERARRAGGRAAVSLDAALSPQGRKEALEHMLDNQQTIVVEQQVGDGDSGAGGTSRLFEYDAADSESDDAH
jgi:hypothetical protein